MNNPLILIDLDVAIKKGFAPWKMDLAGERIEIVPFLRKYIQSIAAENAVLTKKLEDAKNDFLFIQQISDRASITRMCEHAVSSLSE